MRLTTFSSGGGCGCKLSSDSLRDLLQQSGIFSAVPAALKVGVESADDAAVWHLNEQQAIVATADFFSPVVDDPYDFGMIAAANALSDVYAMGATPLFALALAALPSALPASVITAIFSGGREQCRRAEAVIAGGHSISAGEPLYGLAVIGQGHPDTIITNVGARAGDRLLLGKPLGVGVLSAALRREELPADEYALFVHTTTQLNRVGYALAGQKGVHAMTDVTGFGLLGHLAEMCRPAGLGAQLEFGALPLLEPAVAYAKAGMATGASARNRRATADITASLSQLADWQQTLITDPQTSGGLLVAVAPEQVAAVTALFAGHEQQASVIGEITDSGKIDIIPA